MKPKPVPPNSSSPWPRRRGRTGATAAALVRSCALAALFFGALILWFTPPEAPPSRIRAGGSRGPAERGKTAAAEAEAERAVVVVVECLVSTPHSKTPETAASGLFRIAIRGGDAARKGSSAAAFLELVRKGFYDGNYCFRVIEGFIVQWGVGRDPPPSKPAAHRLPRADLPETKAGGARDPGKENRRGTVTMIAGGTGQVFVNLGDNRRLDKEGTIPFGFVLEDEEKDKDGGSHGGMALVDRIYHGYKGGQGQIPAIADGTIPEKFPEMGRIDACYRID